jgi:Glycosyl transferase family 11
MIILTEPYGQASNQFIQHIHLDSFCRSNGVTFYNKFLLKHFENYPNLKIDSEKKLIGLFVGGLTKLRYSSFSFDDRKQNIFYHSLVMKSNILFCKGWHFRSYDTTLKYRSLYQKLFNPSINKKALDKLWLNNENDGSKIIGVHIRRGDYLSFLDGIYFYEDLVYIDKMKQLAALLNYKCRFIIFSNDHHLNISKFNCEFEKILVSNNSAVEDHYLMSKCDYIIGPPSTFSMWASYIGETLLYHINTKSDVVTLDKFYACTG